MIDSCLGARRLKARDGVQLCGYLSSAQDASFCRRPSGLSIIEEQIGTLGREAIFIDCGANVGFYSALAAKTLGPAGTILSLEPSTREFRRLLWAMENNSHECAWIPLNLAAGERPKSICLNTAVGHTGMNRVQPGGQQGQWCGMTTLDDVAKCYLPEEAVIDLVKIDVEGFELQVLRGMQSLLRERRVKTLVVEITDEFLKTYGDSKSQLYVFMEAHGFRPQLSLSEWQYDECFVLEAN